MEGENHYIIKQFNQLHLITGINAASSLDFSMGEQIEYSGGWVRQFKFYWNVNVILKKKTVKNMNLVLNVIRTLV